MDPETRNDNSGVMQFLGRGHSFLALATTTAVLAWTALTGCSRKPTQPDSNFFKISTDGAALVSESIGVAVIPDTLCVQSACSTFKLSATINYDTTAFQNVAFWLAPVIPDVNDTSKHTIDIDNALLIGKAPQPSCDDIVQDSSGLSGPTLRVVGETREAVLAGRYVALVTTGLVHGTNGDGCAFDRQSPVQILGLQVEGRTVTYPERGEPLVYFEAQAAGSSGAKVNLQEMSQTSGPWGTLALPRIPQ